MRKIQTIIAVFMLLGINAAVACAGEDGSAPTSKANPTTSPSSNDGTTDSDGGLTNVSVPAGESPELMMFKDMPVVVAAGMRQQTQQEAAASVSVVSANDIELFNYRSLADVLHGQRSFYLSTDGLNWFAGVRGFQRPGEWNARILVLEDGQPTNDIIYGQSNLDTDFVIPMEAMKQVEIVRGPGSALYGTNAVFGVINQVTKDGSDINGFDVKTEGGTGSTIHQNILFGQKFDDGWDVVADVSGYSSQGDDDIIYDGVTDAAHNYGHIKDADGEGVYSLFFKARKGDFTFEIDNAAREKDNSAASYFTPFNDPGNEYERRTNASIRLDHDFSDTQSLHAMLYYGHYHYWQTFPTPAAPPVPAYNYISEGQDDWLGAQIHYDWQMTKIFHLLAGAEGTQALYILQEDHTDYQGSVLHIPSSYTSGALFVEGELKVTPWLTTTVGGRVDDVQRIGLNASPRFAAVVTPTDKDTIKALYGRAFRDPNLYELQYGAPPPAGNVANPNLNPEVVDTFELDWERQFKSGWRTTLDAYLWKMSNAMYNYTYPDGSIQVRNGDDIWANGVEAEIDRQWANGASFRAYASYTHGEQDGNGLTHSPNWIVGSSTAIQLFKKNFISIEPQIVAPMESDSGMSTHATFITNVVYTSRDFAKGWTFQAGAYNLFAGSARLPTSLDQYQPSINYPQTEYLFSLEHRF
jgi:iron complex outermembrane receptor protein